MKRALTTLIAAAALPLFADEPAKTTTAQPAAQPQATTISAAPAAQPESPLVAAARRANRLGKKPANVITNDNLVKSGNAKRVTTTAEQKPITLPKELQNPARPTPEMVAAQHREGMRKAAELKEQKAREEEAKKKQRTEAAAAQAEEGLFYAEEGASETQNEQPQKPPQF